MAPNNPYNCGIFIFADSKHLSTWIKKGVLDDNDATMWTRTGDIYPFNESYIVDFVWGNNAKGTDSFTKLSFTSNGSSYDYTGNVRAWGNGNYGSKLGYYALDPIMTNSDSDNWNQYAGQDVAGGFDFYIDNGGGWVPANHFYILSMSLHRAIIPFSALLPKGYDVNSYVETSKGISYIYNGYRYSISLADTGEGGIGTIYNVSKTDYSVSNTNKKGFFVQSDLKVAVEPLSADTADKVPTTLYLKDDAGNIHNQNTGSGLTAFTNKGSAYVSTINLSTMSGASNEAKSPECMIGGRYTTLAARGVQPGEVSHSLYFSFDTTQVKKVNIQYYNAKELINDAAVSTGKSVQDIINGIVNLENTKLYGSTNLDDASKNYEYNQVNFSSMKLNSQAAVLAGRKVNISIMNTSTMVTEGNKSVSWSGLSGDNITVVLSDPAKKQLDPIPVVSSVSSINVTSDEGKIFEYEKGYYLGVGFKNLKFEDVHKSDSNMYANGGISFDLSFSSSRLYPLESGQAPNYYKVVVKKVNKTTGDIQNLVSFIHKADEYISGEEVDVLSSGSTVGKYKLIKNKKNSYTLVFQSKNDYSKAEQSGQLFLGNENIVVDVFETDTKENIKEDKSSAKLNYSLSGDDSFNILAAVPTDTMKSQDVGYTTEKQDGQDDFYIYSDNVSSMDLPSFDFDLGAASEAFNTSKVGVAPGLSIDGDEINISLSFSGEPLDDGGSGGDDSGFKKLQKTIQKSKELHQQRKNAKSAATTTQGSTPVSSSTLAAASTPDSSTGGTSTGGSSSSLSKKGEGSFELSGGISITLKYDSMTGSWEFDNMMFAFGIAGGYELTMPLPPCPIFYFHVTAEASLQIATGFMQVPTGYYNGGIQRQIVYAGFNISPELYLGIGAGVGISGLAGVEVSAYVQMSLSATFGRSEVTMGNNIYDFSLDNEDVFTFSDCDDVKEGNDWSNEDDEKAFKNNIITTDIKGGSVTYTVDAYQILVKGNLRTDGGVMKIEVWDANTNVLMDTKLVDTSYGSNVNNVTFYNKNLTKRSTYRVTISLDSSSVDGSKISLDETDYKTLESLYEVNTLPASLDEWRFQFGVKVDIYFLLFGFSIDLIYFYVDQDGIGWGYPFHEEKIKSARYMDKTVADGMEEESGDVEAFNEIARSTEYEDCTKKQSVDSVNRAFNLGEFPNNKTITDIARHVMPTTSSQIYNVGDDRIIIWIADDLSRDSLQRQAIYYSINGKKSHMLDDDGLADTEFTVGEDKSGNAVITWVSSKGIGDVSNVNDIDKLKMVNDSMEIKNAVIDMKTEEIIKDTVLNGTDDDRQDLLPAYATRSDQQIIAYVKDVKTKNEANVKYSYNSDKEDLSEVSEDLNRIENASQTGVHKSYYSVNNGDGFSKEYEIPIMLSSDVWKAGTKITANSLTYLDDHSVLYSFTAKVPNSQKGSYSGVEYQMYVQKGKINTDGTIDFSEGAVCLDKIFDYDESLSVVYPDGNIPSEYIEKLESGDSTQENPTISEVEFKNVKLPDSENKANGTEVTLFYRNKSKLISIDQKNLSIALDLSSKEKFTKTNIMDLITNEYDLNVSDDGDVFIVYTAGSDQNEYDSQIFMRMYNAETKSWSKEKQVTFNSTFNEEALRSENEVSGLKSVNFKSLSCDLDSKNQLSILTMSTESEFKYSYFASKDDSEPVKIAYLDSSNAVRSLNCIGVNFDNDSNIFTGNAPESSTDIHLPSHNVNYTITLQNKGETSLKSGSVETFYKKADGSIVSIGQKNFSGVWSPEQSNNFEFTYTYPANSNDAYDGAVVYYQLKDSDGKVIFDSLEKGLTYTVRQSKSEIIVAADKAEIINENGTDYINYKALVKNIGFKDVTGKAQIKLELLDYNDDYILTPVEQIGILDIPSEVLKTGYTTTDSTNVSLKFAMPDNISSQFRVRATIVGVDEEEIDYSNNSGSLLLLNPTTEIILGHEDSSNVITAKVGEEIVLDGLQVISKQYSENDLVYEENGTGCLSIDNVTDPAKPRIKVMKSNSETKGYTPVTLSVRIKDTTVVENLTLNVTDRQIIDFNTEDTSNGVSYKGFSTIRNCFDYLNDNTISTSSNKSTISFKFTGTGMELYGAKMSNGGSCTIDVSSVSGSNKKVISFVGDNAINISLAKYMDLPYGSYVVNITTNDDKTVVFDRVEIDGAISDLPETEAYSVINDTSDTLDLPMQNGRQRVATVSYDFDTELEEVSGADMKNCELNFSVVGVKDGVNTSLPDVKFTYSNIDGKTVTFTNEKLVSDPNYEKLVYTLKDTSIPSGYLKAKNNCKLTLQIPVAERQVFSLTESGIKSVEVVSCKQDKMMDKALLVTFENPVMTDRLNGTKIVYQYNDKSVAKTLEFSYVSMKDSKTAYYMAPVSDMPSDINSLEYIFGEGIVLNNNFSLISSEGNYIDNILDVNEMPGINYSRARAINAVVARDVANGERAAVYITFDKELELEGISKDDISLEIDQKINDKTKLIKLHYDGVGTTPNTIKLISDDTFMFESGSRVSYSINTNQKIVTDKLVSKYDGYVINKDLTNCTGNTYNFNTSAYIESATLSLAAGEILKSDNVPCVQVVFNKPIDEATIANTYVNVRLTDKIADETPDGEIKSENLKLPLKSVKTLYNAQSNPYTIAEYEYTGNSLSFEDNVVEKRFELTEAAAILGDGELKLCTLDRSTIIAPDIPFNSSNSISYVVENQPTIAALANGKDYEGVDFTNFDVSLTLSGKQSGIYQISKDFGKTWSDMQGDTEIFSEEMDSTFIFRVKDAKGICGRTSRYLVKIDKTAPSGTIKMAENEWTSIRTNVTDKLYYNVAKTFEVRASDSHLEKIYYILSNKEISEEDLKSTTEWKETDGKVDIPTDEFYILYEKAVDEAGNTTILNSDFIVIDQTMPEVTGIDEAKTYCTGKIVTVKDTNLDLVTLNGKEVTLEADKFNIEAAKGIQTIIAKDKAGNSTKIEVTVNNGHTWDKGVEVYPATAAKTGLIRYTCTVCGEIKEDTIEKLPPSITEGKDISYESGSGKGLTFISDASLADFDCIKLDKSKVDSENYTLSEGSTIVELKAEYLEKLSPGKHTISIVSVTGSADAEFTINEKKDNPTETPTVKPTVKPTDRPDDVKPTETRKPDGVKETTAPTVGPTDAVESAAPTQKSPGKLTTVKPASTEKSVSLVKDNTKGASTTGNSEAATTNDANHLWLWIALIVAMLVLSGCVVGGSRKNIKYR